MSVENEQKQLNAWLEQQLAAGLTDEQIETAMLEKFQPSVVNAYTSSLLSLLSPELEEESKP